MKKLHLLLIVLVISLFSGCGVPLIQSIDVNQSNITQIKMNKKATFRKFSELKLTETEELIISYSSLLLNDVFGNIEKDPRMKDVSAYNTGTSLSRSHKYYTKRASLIFRLASWSYKLKKIEKYKSKGIKYSNNAIDILYRLAKMDALLDTMNASRAYSQCCYCGGLTNVCYKHHVQTASAFFAAVIHSAIFLDEDLAKQPEKRKVIDEWIKEGTNKYIFGRINMTHDVYAVGLYQILNGITGAIYYSIYTGDRDMFLKYAKFGMTQIYNSIESDGRLVNNSYRGVRSVFYHSEGVANIFGFGELLENQGIEFFNHPKLKEPLRKTYKMCMRAVDNPKWFESAGSRGISYSTNEKDAIRSITKGGSSLQWIGALRYPDIKIKSLPRRWDDMSMLYPMFFWGDIENKLNNR